MRRHTTLWTALLLVPLAAGCAGARLADTVRSDYSGPAIRTVAVAPGGGLVAEAVAARLQMERIAVMGPSETISVLEQAGLTRAQVAGEAGFQELVKHDVDALLVIRSLYGWDGHPQSVSVRLISTRTAEVITGFAWENGWGGDLGSVADRIMRRDSAEAAHQIVAGLLERVPHAAFPQAPF
jgi:hypothetical protein